MPFQGWSQGGLRSRLAARSLRQMQQRDWLIQVVVRATEAEADATGDRIGEVICVPADHDGQCVTPWTTMLVAMDDLDEPERSDLRSLLHE